MPASASAGWAEHQAGEDDPAENPDDGKCDVQIGDVEGGARITQPPDDSHREEQQDGGERELVGGTRQWLPVWKRRSGTHHDLLVLVCRKRRGFRTLPDSGSRSFSANRPPGYQISDATLVREFAGRPGAFARSVS
ncbi:hypothetical protein Pd630_LPD07761 [Rhodococcus opacus PD630]|nr:hypothetical protein Pd630_LPD07761 [Rhodococcus opacus PD630]